MQLFITEYTKKGNEVTITNTDLLSQLRKVLRASIGDSIRIQDPTNEAQKIRYEVHIEKWNDKDILWKILSEQVHELTSEQTRMIVAMPNKWEKAELIAQKLSEIGISKIIFWPSERSVIKEWNSKKEERILKIIKEAVEQSRWRHVPELIFTSNVAEYVQNAEVIIFDKTGDDQQALAYKKSASIVWIIGPEGWLTTKDYQHFESYTPQIVCLWTTVLRTETAAIVWWRLLKNNK